MSSKLQEIHHLWRRSCRFALRLVGLCLLPWARAADYTAVLITTCFVRLQPLTWHIAAVILACGVLVVVMHAVTYLLACDFFADLRGYLAPCVCEACLQCAGRQAQSNSNLARMFIAILELTRSLVKALLAISQVLNDGCSLVLSHPRASSTFVLISVGFTALIP